MRLLKTLTLVLSLIICVDSMAQSNAEIRKTLRESKRSERQEKRQAKRNAQEVQVESELEASEYLQQTDSVFGQTIEPVEQLEPVGEAPVEKSVTEPTESTVVVVQEQVSEVDQSVVTDTTSEPSQSNDDGAVWLVFILGVYLVYKVFRWVLRRRCPHCKRFFATYVSDEQSQGTTKWETEHKNGKTTRRYTHRYKIWRTCKYCGGRTFYFEDRKE